MRKAREPMLWVMAVLLLIAAIPAMPYAYYTLMRVVVCGISIYQATQFFSESKLGWALFFAAFAVLFNPIIPVHLDRTTWAFINIGGALACFFATRYIPLKSK